MIGEEVNVSPRDALTMLNGLGRRVAYTLISGGA